MAPTVADEQQPPRRDRWYQFGLGKLFLVTTLVAVLAAGWAAMARLGDPSEQGLPMLVSVVVLVLAAPTALLIAVSLFHSFQTWWERRRG
jgi:hypothetical protein